MPAVSETFRLYFLLSLAGTSLVISGLWIYMLWRKPRTAAAEPAPERPAEAAAAAKHF